MGGEALNSDHEMGEKKYNTNTKTRETVVVTAVNGVILYSLSFPASRGFNYFSLIN